MNVLVVYEEKEIREVIAFFLESRFSMNVQEASNSDMAISMLSSDQQGFDLLICDYQKNAKKLISFALEKNITLHFICAAKAIPNDAMLVGRKEWIHFVPDTKIIEGLEKTNRHLFKELQAQPPPTDLDFCKIKPELVLFANPLKGNLYVRLSEQKLVRIMREGLDFDSSDLDYYCNKKKFEVLFIKKQNCLEFSIQIQENLLKRNQKDGAQSGADQILDEKRKRLQILKEKARLIEEKRAEVIELNQATQEAKKENVQNAQVGEKSNLIQEKAKEILAKKKMDELSAAQRTPAPDPETLAKIKSKKEEEEKRAALSKQLEKSMLTDLESVQAMSQRLGFSAEVQELTKQSVGQTIKTIRNIPQLSELLLQIRKEKDKYIASHSMLLAYVSCALASKMEWSSDTTYQKLTLAAFLHDMVLKNNDLAAIQTLEELEQNSKKFSPAEQKTYRDHPALGAEIVRRFHEIPPDVDLIIAQHHERPDGTGFPRGLTHLRIGPLSSVFIISHDIVAYLLSSEQAGNTQNERVLEEFVEKNKGKYVGGNFKKLMTAIPKIKT
jgi:HD-GYP domain-containing protein (c-di-GMP phosphodiesterase class II)